jgi:hypothetical protein
LFQNKDGLTMRSTTLLRKSDICGKFNVSRDLLPHEVEGVFGGPHILASRRDVVGTLLCVILRNAWMYNFTDVGMPLEDSERVRRRLGNRRRDLPKT